MSEMFLPFGQSRITRRSKNELNQPFRKSNIGQNCLSYHGPLQRTAGSFKHLIKDKFFNDLQSQDKMIALAYAIENTKSAYGNAVIFIFSE